MARFAFVGPSYTSQSSNVDCERTVNWYPESVESGQGKGPLALYPTPGLKLHCALPTGPVRGELAINGRMFAVGGSVLYEIDGAGNVTARGNVGSDFLPVSMCTNGTAANQLAVCSAGRVYVFFLAASAAYAANTLIGPVGGLQGFAAKVVFCAGYGVALLAQSNKFQVSNLEDFTTWDPLGVQQVQVFPENVGSILSIFGLLWVLGTDGHSVVYYDSGASQYTPFSVIEGSFMEEGVDAAGSPCMVDNTAFWIGGNQNGGGIAWRANGYTPLRISNHAIEAAWARYPNKASDAISYAYREIGHTFWVLRFPSANNGLGATWVYDVATQMWHERSSGLEGGAHLSGCHAYAFGKHLVGDWNSGNVYAMDVATYTDNEQPIRRLRRAPHVSSEQTWIYHQELQVDLEVGNGPIPALLDGSGANRDPQIMLRWSDDGGKTWGNEHWTGAGQAGTYQTRAVWYRLGRARDRVYEVSVTDPVWWAIADAYLKAAPGFARPMETLAKQFTKIT